MGPEPWLRATILQLQPIKSQDGRDAEGGGFREDMGQECGKGSENDQP